MAETNTTMPPFRVFISDREVLRKDQMEVPVYHGHVDFFLEGKTWRWDWTKNPLLALSSTMGDLSTLHFTGTDGSFPSAETERALCDLYAEWKDKIQDEITLKAEEFGRVIKEKGETAMPTKRDETPEMQKKIDELSKENREIFEALFKAHSEKKEFREHPILVKPFREKLLNLIHDLQKDGVKIQPMIFDASAPSRNPTVVQVKQQNREKEK